jgi:hypothetical protein
LLVIDILKAGLVRIRPLLGSTSFANVLSLIAVVLALIALVVSCEASRPRIGTEVTTGRSYFNRVGTFDGQSTTVTKAALTVRNTGGRATSIEDFEFLRDESRQQGSSSATLYCVDPATVEQMMPYKRQMSPGAKCDFRKRIDTGESSDYPLELVVINPPMDAQTTLKGSLLIKFSDGATDKLPIVITTPLVKQIQAAGFGDK